MSRRGSFITGSFAVRALRITAVALPLVAAARGVSDEPRPLPPLSSEPHAVDIWMGDAAVDVDPAFRLEAERARLASALTAPPVVAPSRGLGVGFQVVGSVAVLQGDELNTAGTPTRRGMNSDTIARVGQQFIQAFGDNYDQIAIFLAFYDYMSPQALAYQMPVKNDITGLGLTMFDGSAAYGSPSGRLQTMLNMKRILAYGRGAADDPDNDLYAVWAQEAAHRWVVYFRYRREQDAANSDALLGRQKAHWARNVQADGSIMDGYLWRDNGDGTYTPVDRDKRYGILDQYGMGLRAAADVPPFFILEDVRQAVDDMPVPTGALARGGLYKATKTVVTVADIVRAMGPRTPATDASAADLRMGVVLLSSPGVPPESLVGESFRIDNTRRLWDDYYNTAGGGRGKVCTELLRPCRGLSLTYGQATITLAPGATGPAPDGGVATPPIVEPGRAIVVTVPVTNGGTESGAAKVKIDARGALGFSRDTSDLDVPSLAPGQSAHVTFGGQIPYGAPCVQALPLDLTTVEKGSRVNPSLGTSSIIVGAVPGPLDDLEGASAGDWKVNPDGTDTASTGKWELGTPERADVFDFVLQPGAAYSGQHAFVTGAARGADPSANDVTGGLTTVESPPMSLQGLTSPHLSYQAYFVGADFQNEVLVPAANDSLRVLASTDGKTWTEVDRLTGMNVGWQRRLVKLSDTLPAEALSAPSLRFRFVAEDADLNTDVEAVIDDVGLLGESPACAIPAPDGGADVGVEPPPGNGCGCRMGGGRAPGPGLAPVLIALALVGWRGRRRN
jgi:MYXO-CTERM domain-containing protein